MFKTFQLPFPSYLRNHQPRLSATPDISYNRPIYMWMPIGLQPCSQELLISKYVIDNDSRNVECSVISISTTYHFIVDVAQFACVVWWDASLMMLLLCCCPLEISPAVSPCKTVYPNNRVAYGTPCSGLMTCTDRRETGKLNEPVKYFCEAMKLPTKVSLYIFYAK